MLPTVAHVNGMASFFLKRMDHNPDRLMQPHVARPAPVEGMSVFSDTQG
jgi:hypothetical protein